MKKNIGKIGICTLVVAMFLAIPVTVNASIPYDYEIVWERDYTDAYANCRVATDSDDNVIVCGTDQDEKGLVLKYDKYGNLTWWDHTSEKVYYQEPGPHPQPMPTTAEELLTEPFGALLDIVVDSNDNIIVAGAFYDSSEKYSVIYIKKYDPDGNEIWTKTYSPFLYSLAMGVDVDSNNDIFIAGYGGKVWPPSVKGFVIKLKGSTGQKLWQSTRTKWGKYTMYYSVVVDSSDDAIAAGAIINPSNEDHDVMITKFGGWLGWRRDELVRATYALPTKVVIDQQGNFVAAGTEENNVQTHYLLKFNPNFNTLWETAGVTEGFLYDVAIMNNGDIAVAGRKEANADEYYAAIYNKNTGNKILDMFLGECVATGWDFFNDYMKGVAVDSAGYLYITGAATVGKTIKVQVTGG